MTAEREEAPRPGQTASRSGLPPWDADAGDSKDETVETFDAFWLIIPKRISTGTAVVDAFEAWKTLAPADRQSVHRCVEEALAGGDDSVLYAWDGSVVVTPAELIPLAQQAAAEGRELWEVIDWDR